MVDASQIAEVRENTDERDDETWSDAAISELIGATGSVNVTSAIIWRRKAAKWAELVDVSEAGASNAFNALMQKALDMAAQYDLAAIVDAETSGSAVTRVKVKVIDRPYVDLPLPRGRWRW